MMLMTTVTNSNELEDCNSAITAQAEQGYPADTDEAPRNGGAMETVAGVNYSYPPTPCNGVEASEEQRGHELSALPIHETKLAKSADMYTNLRTKRSDQLDTAQHSFTYDRTVDLVPSAPCSVPRLGPSLSTPISHTSSTNRPPVQPGCASSHHPVTQTLGLPSNQQSHRYHLLSDPDNHIFTLDEEPTTVEPAISTICPPLLPDLQPPPSPLPSSSPSASNSKMIGLELPQQLPLDDLFAVPPHLAQVAGKKLRRSKGMAGFNSPLYTDSEQLPSCRPEDTSVPESPSASRPSSPYPLGHPSRPYLSALLRTRPSPTPVQTPHSEPEPEASSSFTQLPAEANPSNARQRYRSHVTTSAPPTSYTREFLSSPSSPRFSPTSLSAPYYSGPSDLEHALYPAAPSSSPPCLVSDYSDSELDHESSECLSVMPNAWLLPALHGVPAFMDGEAELSTSVEDEARGRVSLSSNVSDPAFRTTAAATTFLHHQHYHHPNRYSIGTTSLHAAPPLSRRYTAPSSSSAPLSVFSPHFNSFSHFTDEYPYHHHQYSHHRPSRSRTKTQPLVRLSLRLRRRSVDLLTGSGRRGSRDSESRDALEIKEAQVRLSRELQRGRRVCSDPQSMPVGMGSKKLARTHSDPACARESRRSSVPNGRPAGKTGSRRPDRPRPSEPGLGCASTAVKTKVKRLSDGFRDFVSGFSSLGAGMRRLSGSA